MFRVVVPLNQAEMNALVVMAQAECRHPRDELRHILLAELRWRGLLRDSTDQAARDAARVPSGVTHASPA